MSISPRLVWAPRALADLDRQLTAIRHFDRAAASRTGLAVEAKAHWLLDFPYAGSPQPKGLRKVIVTRTRLLIVYRPRQHGVEIVRVFHERQNWR